MCEYSSQVKQKEDVTGSTYGKLTALSWNREELSGPDSECRMQVARVAAGRSAEAELSRFLCIKRA